jgi:hypothetical protein
MNATSDEPVGFRRIWLTELAAIYIGLPCSFGPSPSLYCFVRLRARDRRPVSPWESAASPTDKGGALIFASSSRLPCPVLSAYPGNLVVSQPLCCIRNNVLNHGLPQRVFAEFIQSHIAHSANRSVHTSYLKMCLAKTRAHDKEKRYPWSLDARPGLEITHIYLP